MVEGRQRDQWTHTCEVLAMIANTVRNPKKRRKPYLGRDLFPFAPERRVRKSKEPTTDISSVIQFYGIQPNRKP